MTTGAPVEGATGTESSEEHAGSMPGLFPTRICPDDKCQVLCFQESRRSMYNKLTDSPSGTSLPNKK